MSRTASAMAETICPPHIEGRHPMLYFNIQSTEKYSIAMCYTETTGCFLHNPSNHVEFPCHYEKQDIFM